MRTCAKKRVIAPRGVVWLMLLGTFCAGSAKAQLAIGDNLKMRLNGTVGAGYSAGFGDSGSNHNQNLLGNGTLSGYYYNPGFLSFTARPYWDRNKNNNESGAVNRDSGIDTSMTLFSGSSFPVSVSYGKGISNNSQFGLGGVGGGLETHGSGQSFSVTVNEVLPDKPPVYATYSVGTSDYSALGSTGDNHTSTKNFNIGTNYNLLGFSLAGNFNHGSSNYEYSSLLGFASAGNSSTNSYSVSAQHPLPLRGGLGITWARSSYENSSNGGNNGSTSSTGATSSFMPWNRLSISGQAQYTTNVSAALSQEFLPGSIGILNSDSGSHSLSLSTGAGLHIGHGWSATGNATRNSTSYLGHEYVSTQYSGMMNYQFTHNLLGFLHFGFGLVDMAGKQGNSGTSLVGNVGMDRKVGRWNTSADFSYSQEIQTLYGVSTTSSYNYGGSIRRKFNDTTYWSATFRAAHSGISQQEGNKSGSESVSSSFAWRRYSVSGSYSQSNGTTIFSSAGVLTPVVGAGLLTNDFMLFNGHSFTMSGATRLFRRINVSGAYSRSRSTIEAAPRNTFTESHIYNAHFDYRLRKMTLTGGYSRVNQSATSIKNGPFMLNSFYLSFSRWFNVF